MTDLETLAHGVLFPSIGRPGVPKWLPPRIDAGLGGVVLYGSDIHSREQVASLTTALHGLRDHVLVATDEEGGDVTRLEEYGGTSVPGNYALGRIDDLDATRRCAEQIGYTLLEAGIDWDLAPAVDVISNPLSPNAMRTFGDDRARASEHAAAWIAGLQGTGVSACAKHFPGHGRSGKDAHYATPSVDLSRAELLGWYLEPFRASALAGVDGIMVSHVQLPQLDGVYPASISRAAITDLLRDELGYTGCVITDALEMRGVRDVARLGESVVLALAAGVDALCLGSASYDDDVETSVRAILAAVDDGVLSADRLEDAVERIGKVGTRAKADRAGRDDSVGLELAAQASDVVGDPVLRGEHILVVRFEPEHSPAVGSRGAALEPLLEQAGYDCETLSMPGESYNGLHRVTAEMSLFRREFGSDAEVVLLVRSPHRYEWQRELLDILLKRYPDVVVVDMGATGLDLSAARGWIRTYGASRACTHAAAALLKA